MSNNEQHSCVVCGRLYWVPVQYDDKDTPQTCSKKCETIQRWSPPPVIEF